MHDVRTRTLADHKAVVQRWRVRQVSLGRDSVQVTPPADGSALEWLGLRPSDTQASENDTLVTDTDVVTTRRPDNRDAASLRSVGQIRRVYRTRARREEAENARRVFQPQVDEHKAPSPPPAACPLPPVALNQSPENEQNDVKTPEADDCLRLDALALVTDATFRVTVLRSLRRDLSGGHNVRVVVNNLTNVSVADVRLVVQQLCTESLLFCVRDQNVVPSVDNGLVTLELVARHRASVNGYMRT